MQTTKGEFTCSFIAYSESGIIKALYLVVM